MARHSVTYDHTSSGSAQTLVIPSTYLGGFQFDIAGGQGGYDYVSSSGYSGIAQAGRVTGTYNPNVGDTLHIYVGAAGGVSGGLGSGSTGGAGGWGYHSGGAGGTTPVGSGFAADGGAGGGGSSAVVDGSTLIAEAGGGGGTGGQGGNTGAPFDMGTGGGGGAVPGSGTQGSGNASPGGAGAAATPAAGGAGGAAGVSSANGAAGSAGGAGTSTVGGAGGAGGSGNASFYGGGPGGGGGGGTFGGGGGGGAGGGTLSSGAGAGGGLSSAPAATSSAFFDASVVGLSASKVTVSWLTQPTATATAPTGTVTNTGTPTLAANYSSADSASQQAYRVMVYRQSDIAGAGGVTNAQGPNPPNPAPAPLYDSGTVFSGGPGVSIPSGPLPNGALVAYFCFEDSAGSDSEWSQWASTTWTQSAPVPHNPVATVTPQPAQAQVQVTTYAPDNLESLDDSDLENTIGTWAAVANCAVARTNAQAQHGSWSLSLTSTAAGNMSARTAGKYKVTAGARYVGMVSFRSAVSARSCQAQIQWYDATGAALSVSTGGAVADTTTGWTQATVTANAPAGAASADIFPLVQATGAGSEVHYVDEAGIFYAPAGTPVWVQGGVYPTSYVVQRSLDGGATWTTCQGGAAIASNGGLVTFIDIGAPREQPISYQVQSVALNVSSAWTAAGPTYLSSDGNDWLFSASSRALSTKITYQGPNLSALSNEDLQVYYPEGRQDAVVFHGTIHYEEFVSGMGSQLLTFAFPNDAAWNTFKAMRAAQLPLLLKTVYGDTGREQFWIVLGSPAGTVRYGGGDKALAGSGLTQQIRTVQIPAYVVKEPV